MYRAPGRDIPAGWNEALAKNGRRYYYNGAGDVRWGHPSLPKGWSESVDTATGKSFYSHRSGKSQWEFPVGAVADPMAAATALALAADGNTLWGSGTLADGDVVCCALAANATGQGHALSHCGQHRGPVARSK